MNLITEFENVQDLVEQIMEKDIRARNDDKWLVYQVMRHFTNVYIKFEDFKKIPSFETVTRVRRRIQNDEGRLIPTDVNVINKRQLREQAVKKWATD